MFLVALGGCSWVFFSGDVWMFGQVSHFYGVVLVVFVFGVSVYFFW